MFPKIELCTLTYAPFQYIDVAMETSRDGSMHVSRLNDTLGTAHATCRKTSELQSGIQRQIKSGKTLLTKSRGLIKQAAKHFKDLAGFFATMERYGKGLEKTEIGLSAIVEDYRER